MKRATCSALYLILALVGTGCASTSKKALHETPPPDLAAVAAKLDTLHATLYQQLSEEYRGAALQAFAAARLALERALGDPSWTAATEQTGDYFSLPPAIIADVDETIFDNSPFQVGLIKSGTRYTTAKFNAWCGERRAWAIPGAVEFLKAAADRGVTVFYVTNRRKDVREATRDNLRALGFPLRDDLETVYVRGLKPEWDKDDKSPRRRAIAATHRILLLLGDDLNDFVAARGLTTAERQSLAEPFTSHWGERWIVLPNPTYGSWLDSVAGIAGAEATALELKLEALQN